MSSEWSRFWIWVPGWSNLSADCRDAELVAVSPCHHLWPALPFASIRSSRAEPGRGSRTGSRTQLCSDVVAPEKGLELPVQPEGRCDGGASVFKSQRQVTEEAHVCTSWPNGMCPFPMRAGMLAVQTVQSIPQRLLLLVWPPNRQVNKRRGGGSQVASPSAFAETLD